MSRSRRIALVLALPAVLAVAACGNVRSRAEIAAAEVGSGQQVVTTTSAPDSTVPSVAAAVGGVTPTDAAAPTGAAPATGATVGQPQTGTATTAAGTSGQPAPVQTSSAPTTTVRSNAPTTKASPGFSGKQDTTPVVICQIGTFTGVTGPLAAGAQVSLGVWVKYINAHGGLAGHPVQLDSKDDATDGNKALQAAQNCVQNEHAAAFVALETVSTFDNIGSYVAGKKVPMVGDSGTTPAQFQNPYFFNDQSSTNAISNATANAMKRAGETKLALLYCAETPSCGNSAKAAGEAASKQGITVKGSYSATTANPSFTSQCSQMKSDGVQAVYVATDGGSIQRFARDCKGVGYSPTIICGVLALTPDVADDPNLDGLIGIAGVFPWVASDTPAQKLFQQAMATYAPDVLPGESAARGWASAVMFQTAIENLGDEARTQPLTSALILKGLGLIKNSDLGGLLTGKVSFSLGEPNSPGSPCTGIVKISGGQWTTPYGTAPICS